MTKYKCGHTTNGMIILDENLLSMSAYIQWAEEENNLETKEECFDCYLKKLSPKISNEKEIIETETLNEIKKAERQRAKRIIWKIQKQTVRNSASYQICNQILKEITETK